MKRYEKGPFTVTIARDGAIMVRHGDWISKYAMAVYNDPMKGWDKFGRMNKFGQIEVLHDPARIYAGEKLYHIPTYREFRGNHEIAVNQPPISQVKKAALEKYIVKKLAEEQDLPGEEVYELFHKFSESSDIVFKGIEIAEIIGALHGSLEVIAVGGGILDLALMLPLMTIGFLHETTQDRKLLACLAHVYTVTAWGFDDPLPPRISRQFLNQGGGMDQWQREKYQEVWDETCQETEEGLEAYLKKENFKKQNVQYAMKLVSENDPKKLAKALWKGMDKHMRGSAWPFFPESGQSDALFGQFISGYRINYPD